MPHNTKPKRADHAQDLRRFADLVARLPLASHRDPERPHVERKLLVDEMRERARQIVRLDEPTPESVFRANDVVRDGRVVKVQIRRTPGTLKLAA
jgi:glyoxylase-like metal-dependent hydrolase (beta-lactamase superfamily II)